MEKLVPNTADREGSKYETFREFLEKKAFKPTSNKWGGDRKKNPFKVSKPTVINPSIAAITEIPEGPMRSVKGKLTSQLKRDRSPCKPRRPGMIVQQSKKTTVRF